MIHGALAHSGYFGAIIEPLMHTGRRVITVDLRGHVSCLAGYFNSQYQRIDDREEAIWAASLCLLNYSLPMVRSTVALLFDDDVGFPFCSACPTQFH